MSSFCSAKATHIFSANSVNVFAIFQARNFNVTLANNFVKFWPTGPCHGLTSGCPGSSIYPHYKALHFSALCGFNKVLAYRIYSEYWGTLITYLPYLLETLNKFIILYVDVSTIWWMNCKQCRAWLDAVFRLALASIIFLIILFDTSVK